MGVRIGRSSGQRYHVEGKNLEVRSWYLSRGGEGKGRRKRRLWDLSPEKVR